MLSTQNDVYNIRNIKLNLIVLYTIYDVYLARANSKRF